MNETEFFPIYNAAMLRVSEAVGAFTSGRPQHEITAEFAASCEAMRDIRQMILDHNMDHDKLTDMYCELHGLAPTPEELRN